MSDYPNLTLNGRKTKLTGPLRKLWHLARLHGIKNLEAGNGRLKHGKALRGLTTPHLTPTATSATPAATSSSDQQQTQADQPGQAKGMGQLDPLKQAAPAAQGQDSQDEE